jgi:hypothetical protein
MRRGFVLRPISKTANSLLNSAFYKIADFRAGVKDFLFGRSRMFTPSQRHFYQKTGIGFKCIFLVKKNVHTGHKSCYDTNGQQKRRLYTMHYFRKVQD